MKSPKKEVQYEVKHGYICITPCMMVDGIDRPFIGSGKCRECRYFSDIDREKKIVYCRYNIRTNASNNNQGRARKILCCESGTVYSSYNEAAKDLNISISSVTKSARLGIKVLDKFTFKFL